MPKALRKYRLGTQTSLWLRNLPLCPRKRRTGTLSVSVLSSQPPDPPPAPAPSSDPGAAQGGRSGQDLPRADPDRCPAPSHLGHGHLTGPTGKDGRGGPRHSLQERAGRYPLVAERGIRAPGTEGAPLRALFSPPRLSCAGPLGRRRGGAGWRCSVSLG